MNCSYFQALSTLGPFESQNFRLCCLITLPIEFSFNNIKHLLLSLTPFSDFTSKGPVNVCKLFWLLGLSSTVKCVALPSKCVQKPSISHKLSPSFPPKSHFISPLKTQHTSASHSAFTPSSVI